MPLDLIKPEIQTLISSLNKRKAFVIVGAGVSSASIDSDSRKIFGTWTNLLRYGITFCCEKCNTKDNWGSSCLACLDNEYSTTKELLKIGDEIWDCLERHDKVQEWLDIFDDASPENRELIVAIRALGVPIATANYDKLLEDITHLTPITFYEKQKVIDFIRNDQKQKYILHLHGYYKKPESIVLGQKSYDKIVQHELAQFVNKYIPTSYDALIFIGFGQGVYDQNFSLIFQWATKYLNRTKLYHIVLNKYVNETKETHQKNGNPNVVVLGYGENYDELTPYINALAHNIDHDDDLPKTLEGRPTCIGQNRLDLVEDIALYLSKNYTKPVGILGISGLGKTNLVLNVLHHKAIAQKYSQNCFFVRCDGAESLSLLQKTLMNALGMPESSGDLGDKILNYIRRKECSFLISLDNFEVPWRDKINVKPFLEKLKDYADLIFTYSNNTSPNGLEWKVFKVPQLKLKDAAILFNNNSDENFSNNPIVEVVVKGLNFLPSDIILFANEAKNVTDLENFYSERKLKEKKIIENEEQLDIKESKVELETKMTDIMNQIIEKNDFIFTIGRIKRILNKSIRIVEKENSSASNKQTNIGIDIKKRLELQLQQCKSQTFKVAVMALVKSGKSTFLNALLGDEFLPMTNIPETALPVHIRHSNSNTDSALINKGVIIAEGSKKILDKIHSLNAEYRDNRESMPELILSSNVKILEENEMDTIKFEILDTPGFGESDKKSGNMKTFSQSNEELIDSISVIIYLLDYTKLKTEKEDEVLTKLASIRPDLLDKIQERLFFIVNKIDLKSSNGLSVEETIKYVDEFISSKIPELSKSNIMTISSSNALLSRMVLDEKASEERFDDFGRICFGSYYDHLKVTETTEELKKKVKEWGPKKIIDSNILSVEENIIQFIYNNRGKILTDNLLNSLERILKEYRNKYLLTAQGSLNATVDEIEKLEKRINNVKKNQNSIDREAKNFEIEIKKWVRTEFEKFEKTVIDIIESSLEDKDIQLVNNKIEVLDILTRLRNTIKIDFGSEKITSPNNSLLMDKIRNLNKIISLNLQELLNTLNTDIEEKIISKQRELLKKIENTINEAARIFEDTIGTSLKISLNPVPLQMEHLDIDKTIEDLNEKAKELVNSKVETRQEIETNSRIIKEKIKNPEKTWIIEFWIPTFIEQQREEYYNTWVERQYTMYEISKTKIKNDWIQKIRERQKEMVSITEKAFIDNQIVKIISDAKNLFNDYVDDYLNTIQIERNNLEIGGEEYLTNRLIELRESDNELEEILSEVSDF